VIPQYVLPPSAPPAASAPPNHSPISPIGADTFPWHVSPLPPLPLQEPFAAQNPMTAGLQPAAIHSHGLQPVVADALEFLFGAGFSRASRSGPSANSHNATAPLPAVIHSLTKSCSSCEFCPKSPFPPHPRSSASICGYPFPSTDVFGNVGQEWLIRMALRPRYRQYLDSCLKLFDQLTKEIKKSDGVVYREAQKHPEVNLVTTAPGVGVFTGL